MAHPKRCALMLIKRSGANAIATRAEAHPHTLAHAHARIGVPVQCVAVLETLTWRNFLEIMNRCPSRIHEVGWTVHSQTSIQDSSSQNRVTFHLVRAT